MKSDEMADRDSEKLLDIERRETLLKYYDPTDQRLHILGRTVAGTPLPLFWTASGVELWTDASELWFDVESDYELWEEWIRIEVEGCCIQRMIVPRGRSRICAFRGFPADVVRRVRLLKEVQPMREDEKRFLSVWGLECDGEILPVPGRKYRFEFVGDSLSSGEGLGGYAGLTGAGSAMFGLEGHYALKTAERFDADFRILSQSGWGVYCSCYNDLIRIMPRYYEQVCGVLTGERNKRLGAFRLNDFAAWKPDVVIVNLGSNDGFALDREAWQDPATGKVYRQVTNSYGGVEERSALRFEGAVKEFLVRLRKCNPESWLLWAYGMCDHRMAPYLERAVAQYKAETGDERADFLILPATISRWTGSSGHPGAVTHGYAAQVLGDKIEESLGGRI